MKLNHAGLKDLNSWKEAGIMLPSYDVEKVTEKTQSAPQWVHFGIGNIFRVFIGGIVDGLLEQGIMDRGLTCVETFDYEVADKIYKPFDNLVLSVILKNDGTRENKVLGSLAEAIKADFTDAPSVKRLREIFAADSLQMVSFTVTEKGYALKDAGGKWYASVWNDMEEGPEKCVTLIGIVTAMLLVRFQNGKKPIALVSMDNCAHNGELLRQSVLTMAQAWLERKKVAEEFVDYLKNEEIVAFPWTMIDKITPRPSQTIADELEKLGLEEMHPVITGKRTYIAPFANAEKAQYLVIEDHFPNGRPHLEKGFGVYMTDRETVIKAERMKVTACLNPVHSALGPIGVVLGTDLFADLLDQAELRKLARNVAYGEGLPMVENPGIISPEDFTDELFTDRFPNRYLGDTNLRLCTDITQGVGVRFGETIKAVVRKEGTAKRLSAIPVGIAGLMRYMMAVDDQGNAFELAPDPLAKELHEQLSTVKWGHPETFTDQLRSVLSNTNIFFTNLYDAGIGKKIEDIFREMIAGKDSCEKTVKKYVEQMKDI